MMRDMCVPSSIVVDVCVHVYACIWKSRWRKMLRICGHAVVLTKAAQNGRGWVEPSRPT